MSMSILLQETPPPRESVSETYGQIVHDTVVLIVVVVIVQDQQNHKIQNTKVVTK